VDSKPLFFVFSKCFLAENQSLKIFKSLDSRSKACGKDGGKVEFFICIPIYVHQKGLCKTPGVHTALSKYAYSYLFKIEIRNLETFASDALG